eukprot:CAMPEP_0174310254 /NCGR_PEP_ID=MMETSP0810-20121108/2934_1 /TAXON_ID=73025 ORGANISM="Eutreptiella gymnastica-like, Strain CCMP1594" /NCGR_SAMPLE_ID=MMETSP0810 /ASSEMBLY_ACC=CAM_ASM_000659 /LENGTH=627 /DNA_ID=CAMNT_0015418119 /DNA_START=95 /DNA_END=1979 /DNA_ORIENTATION=+
MTQNFQAPQPLLCATERSHYLWIGDRPTLRPGHWQWVCLVASAALVVLVPFTQGPSVPSMALAAPQPPTTRTNPQSSVRSQPHAPRALHGAVAAFPPEFTVPSSSAAEVPTRDVTDALRIWPRALGHSGGGLAVFLAGVAAVAAAATPLAPPLRKGPVGVPSLSGRNGLSHDVRLTFGNDNSNITVSVNVGDADEVVAEVQMGADNADVMFEMPEGEDDGADVAPYMTCDDEETAGRDRSLSISTLTGTKSSTSGAALEAWCSDGDCPLDAAEVVSSRVSPTAHKRPPETPQPEPMSAHVLHLRAKFATQPRRSGRAQSGWVADLSREEELQQLERRMHNAVAAEDYMEAARLRNVMRDLCAPEDRQYLAPQLQKALDAEQFYRAAMFRDQLAAHAARRWARPIDVEDIRPGTVIMRVAQGPEHIPKSMRRAVILVVMHDKHKGSLGVVLNNLLGPLGTPRVFPFAEEIEALCETSPDTWLYDGGPASVKSLTVLHQQKEVFRPEHSDLSTDMFDLFADIRHLAQANPTFVDTVQALRHGDACPSAARVFSGHVVWQPGALEAEAAQGKWFPALISPALIFSETGGRQMWNEVWDLLRVWYEQHLGLEGTSKWTPEVNRDGDSAEEA